MIALLVFDLDSTIQDSLIQSLFPDHAHFHRHSQSVAYVAFYKFKNIKTYLNTYYNYNLNGCTIKIKYAPDFIALMMSKVFSTHTPELLVPNSKTVVTDPFVTLLVYATANMSIPQWNQCWPNCFFIHRTASRNKAIILYSTIELAKRDILANEQQVVTINDKNEEIFVKTHAYLSSVADCYSSILHKDTGYMTALKDEDKIIDNVVQYVLV